MIGCRETSSLIWLKSVSLYITFAVTGQAATLVGTTLVHLEIFINMRPQYVSLIYLGYFFGAILCVLMYDRLLPEFGICLFHAISACTTIGASFIQDYKLFIGIMVFQQVGVGSVEAAGQPYGVRLWQHNKFRKPLLQLLHVIWSFGGIVGPIIVAPFLCGLNRKLESSDDNLYNETVTSQFMFNASANSMYCIDGNLENIKYAYIYVGSMHLMASTMFIVCMLCDRCKGTLKWKINGSGKKSGDDTNTPEMENMFSNHVSYKTEDTLKKKLIFILLLVLIFCYALLDAYLEGSPITFLVSFGIKHLQWSVTRSSILLSVFFGAHVSSRILSVFLSQFIKSQTMLLSAMGITVIACLSLQFTNIWKEIVWASIALAGFSIGTFYPTVVVWMSENIKLTGVVSGVLCSGVGLGITTGSYLVGMMTSEYGQMFFVYFLIVTSLAIIFVFLAKVTLISKTILHINVDICDQNVQLNQN